MNILTDRPPTSIKVGDESYTIRSDFRTGIAFEIAVEAGEEDINKLLKLYFERVPKNITEAVKAVLWFFRCGQEKKKDSGNGGNGKQGYSFVTDSTAIYADFLKHYGIDLSSAALHWWTFRALLMGLPDDSNFKMRVYYRTCDLKKLPKNERERIKKIRKQIEIETNTKTGGKLSLVERNAKMLAYVTKRSAEAQESEVGVNGG